MEPYTNHHPVGADFARTILLTNFFLQKVFKSFKLLKDNMVLFHSPQRLDLAQILEIQTLEERLEEIEVFVTAVRENQIDAHRLYHALPNVIDAVFGYDQTRSWLDIPTGSTSVMERRQSVGEEGTMFDFSVDQLPKPISMQIRAGDLELLSPFLRGKVSGMFSPHQSPSVITLNIFEYFLAKFVKHPTLPRCNSIRNHRLCRTVYHETLWIYFHTFLPSHTPKPYVDAKKGGDRVIPGISHGKSPKGQKKFSVTNEKEISWTTHLATFASKAWDLISPEIQVPNGRQTPPSNTERGPRRAASGPVISRGDVPVVEGRFYKTLVSLLGTSELRSRRLREMIESCFLDLCCDYWLCQNIDNASFDRLSSILYGRMSLGSLASWGGGGRSDVSGPQTPFSHRADSKNEFLKPSVMLFESVLCLVEFSLAETAFRDAFSNEEGADGSIQSSFTRRRDQGMSHLDVDVPREQQSGRMDPALLRKVECVHSTLSSHARGTVCDRMHRPLYLFLKIVFQNWRMPVGRAEDIAVCILLVFLQPWKGSADGSGSGRVEEHTHSLDRFSPAKLRQVFTHPDMPSRFLVSQDPLFFKSVSKDFSGHRKWSLFVADHFVFYTSLFIEFVTNVPWSGFSLSKTSLTHLQWLLGMFATPGLLANLETLESQSVQDNVISAISIYFERSPVEYMELFSPHFREFLGKLSRTLKSIYVVETGASSKTEGNKGRKLAVQLIRQFKVGSETGLHSPRPVRSPIGLSSERDSCSTALDVEYTGDPLLRPITSKEFPPVTRQLYRLSKGANEYFGLDYRSSRFFFDFRSSFASYASLLRTGVFLFFFWVLPFGWIWSFQICSLVYWIFYFGSVTIWVFRLLLEVGIEVVNDRRKGRNRRRTTVETRALAAVSTPLRLRRVQEQRTRSPGSSARSQQSPFVQSGSAEEAPDLDTEYAYEIVTHRVNVGFGIWMNATDILETIQRARFFLRHHAKRR